MEFPNGGHNLVYGLNISSARYRTSRELIIWSVSSRYTYRLPLNHNTAKIKPTRKAKKYGCYAKLPELKIFVSFGNGGGLKQPRRFLDQQNTLLRNKIF
jgi:hypothetical protein